MNSSACRRSIGILLIVCFLYMVAPITAWADWHDRSDELKGSSDATPYLIAGGVVVAAVVVYILVKHNKKKQEDAKPKPAEMGMLESSGIRPDAAGAQLRLLLDRSPSDPELRACQMGQSQPGWRVGLQMQF